MVSGGDDWLLCSSVRADLEHLPSILLRIAEGAEPVLREMLAHLVSLGGKRLRPALLLIARGGDGADDVALAAAAAVEIIHVSSLHHDDVMDRAEQRRGADSVNGRWGNGAATLAGTLLYARAQQALRAAGPKAVLAAAAATSRLCAGQLRESENAFNRALSLDEHLQILDEKTATLFVLAVEVGAAIGGRTAADTDALKRFASHFGRAFQLRDDLLDWTGGAERMGKATRADLRGGIYTLPVLLALRADPGGPLEALLSKRTLADDEFEHTAGLVAPHLAEAEQYLHREVDGARTAIAELPAGNGRASLENLLALSVSREA